MHGHKLHRKLSFMCVCGQVLARARERGDGEECGLEEEEDSGDSSEEEDIVTEFPISNGGNSSLAEVLKVFGRSLYWTDKKLTEK